LATEIAKVRCDGLLSLFRSANFIKLTVVHRSSQNISVTFFFAPTRRVLHPEGGKCPLPSVPRLLDTPLLRPRRRSVSASPDMQLWFNLIFASDTDQVLDGRS